MDSRTLRTQPFHQVGTKTFTGDASKMSSSERHQLLASTNSAFMDHEWDRTVLLLAEYQSGEWIVGINAAKPGIKEFGSHVRSLNIDLSDAQLTQRLEVCVVFSKFDDPGMIDEIKAMGFSKPHIAVPYMGKVKTAGDARRILEVCKNTPAITLRSAIMDELGISRRTREFKENTKGKAAIREIVTSPTRLINNELFVPREGPRDYGLEVAWTTLFSELSKANKSTVEDIFDGMMRELYRSAPTALQMKVQARWENRIEDAGLDEGEFPL